MSSQFKTMRPMNRRLAGRALGTIVAAGLSLAVTAGVANAAQSFGPTSVVSGTMYAHGNCHYNRGYGDVSMSVQEPYAYRTSGLYFYTLIYAKAHSATTWTLLRQGVTPLIKTWSWVDLDGGLDYGWSDSVQQIAWTSFTGALTVQYDDKVIYYYAPPGATTWTGPFGFQLGTETINGTYFDDFTEWNDQLSVGLDQRSCVL